MVSVNHLLECYFGTVENEYYEGRIPCYNLKPNYIAMRTMFTILNGYRFSLNMSSNNYEYVLLFEEPKEQSLVYTVWNVKGHATLKVSTEEKEVCYTVINYLNDKQNDICSDKSGVISVNVSDAPTYLIKKKKEY